MSHLETFARFADETFKSKAWGLLLSDGLQSLSKSKLVKATGIPRSAFYQDRALMSEVERVETKLRRAGIVKKFEKVTPCEAIAVDAIEQIGLLDQLFQRLNVIEAGRESLYKRLLALDEQMKPYADGMRQ